MTEHHEAIADSFDADQPRDPEWYKRAVFYEVLIRGFQDDNGDGTGDLRGLISRLDYLEWLGIDCLWLLPIYQSPLRDGGYDISDFMSVLDEYGNIGDFIALVDEAHKRGIRVVADLVMNHTSDQHPWFQASRSDPDGPYGDFYVWSDTDDKYSGARVIFVDTEASNWTFDPVRGQYYWHRFFSHQPDLNFENPQGPGRDDRGAAVLAGPGHRRLPARRGALPVRARGHQLREPQGNPRVPEADQGRDRQALPGQGAAGRGEPVARRRDRVLRRPLGRRGRVPHGVPLPAHAAHLHGRAPGAALPDHGDPGPDPGRPGRLPVGHLPAQPRRADAGDGDRRRARLHVRRVRQGSPDEGQHRDPAAAGAAAGRRPEPARAVHRAAAVAARLAGAVLRRRDRHGRQHLAGRPGRRADPDAVDARPQRRLLPDRPAAAVPAADHGRALRLPGAQRGGPAAQPGLVPAVDQAHDRDPQAAPGVRHGHLRGADLLQPERAGLRPAAFVGGPGYRRLGPHLVRQQPVPVPAAGRAGPAAVHRRHAGGIHGRGDVPPDRRAQLPADPARPRVLLVPAARRPRRTGGGAPSGSPRAPSCTTVDAVVDAGSAG